MPVPKCTICGAPSKDRICFRCRRRVALRRAARTSVNISLPPELLKVVREKLEERGETLSACIRRLLIAEFHLPPEFDLSFYPDERKLQS